MWHARSEPGEMPLPEIRLKCDDVVDTWHYPEQCVGEELLILNTS